MLDRMGCRGGTARKTWRIIIENMVFDGARADRNDVSTTKLLLTFDKSKCSGLSILAHQVNILYTRSFCLLHITSNACILMLWVFSIPCARGKHYRLAKSSCSKFPSIDSINFMSNQT